MRSLRCSLLLRDVPTGLAKYSIYARNEALCAAAIVVLRTESLAKRSFFNMNAIEDNCKANPCARMNGNGKKINSSPRNEKPSLKRAFHENGT